MRHRTWFSVVLVALLIGTALAAPAGATAGAERVSAGAWTAESSGTTGFLSGVSAVSPAVAYAVGQYGTILRTTNGGVTWTRLSSPMPSDEEVTDVDFVTSSIGYAIGAANAILKTTDGGATWTGTSFLGYIYPPKLLTLSAPDATHARVGGYDMRGGYNDDYSLMLGTNDGTKWWASSLMAGYDYGHGVMGISFPDANHGWAVTVDGDFTLTTNGGGNWTPPLHVIGVSSFSDVGFCDTANGWAVGQASYSDGFVMHTTDGGQNWTRQAEAALSQEQVSDITSVCAVSPTVCWAVGWGTGGGYVLYTTDGGTSWTLENPTTAWLKSVSFVNADTGWVVGDSGTILRHGPALPVDKVKPVPKALASAKVKRGRVAKLKYRVVDASGVATVVIKVKNRAGKVKKTLALGVQPCGKTLTAQFKTSLSKGVYKWYVYATDGAGNRQNKAAWQKLTVY
jgi:photosystem II stability/assembly factor-like uncharacterized protein